MEIAESLHQNFKDLDSTFSKAEKELETASSAQDLLQMEQQIASADQKAKLPRKKFLGCF